MYKQLLMLANAANIANCLCKNSKYPPVITVADSSHLLVNWADSFEECDIQNVKSASIEIDNRKAMEVTFEDKKAKVPANPCVRHTLRVELKHFYRKQFSTRTVWSHIASVSYTHLTLPTILLV